MTRTQTFRIAVRKFGPFEQAIREQWEAFDRTIGTGLQPEFVALDLKPLEDALFDSGGMLSGDWDVAFVATDWISAMHEQSCAVDLAPLLAAGPPQEWPSGWTPSLLRLQNIGGAVMGVPYHDGPECLVYRRDLFEDPEHRERFRRQFGRELLPPRTWQQFHETARFFHNPARGLYGTVFAGLPDGHNSVYDFLLQLWTRGGELCNADGSIRFNTPEACAGLAFYRAMLRDRTAVHPECRTLDSVAAGMRFAAGEVAMMVNWFGFAAMAHRAPESRVRGCVDIAPLPCEPPGQSVSLNVYWVLSIAAGSPHREVAWQFLHHTLSPAMDRLTTLRGAIGCRKSTWRDPVVNAQIPFYARLEELHQVACEIPQRADWPGIASTIDRLMVAAIESDAPVEDLLAAADAELFR